MLTKETFINQIKLLKEFDNNITELQNLNIDLVESKLYDIPLAIFDNFIDSHFTDEAQDIIYWWIWEDCPHNIYYDTIFGREGVSLETSEDLWKFLISDKELYFK